MRYNRAVPSTYTLSGPTMEEQDSEVQYSDTTPYIRFTWLKNEIAETDRKHTLQLSYRPHGQEMEWQ